VCARAEVGRIIGDRAHKLTMLPLHLPQTTMMMLKFQFRLGVKTEFLHLTEEDPFEEW